MHKHTHIIHKQTIEVRMPPGKSPFAVQEKIRQVYYDKILARLDGLFSELVTGDVIIRLDRLDIDIGSVDGERLEQELTEKTIHAAREILKEKLRFRADESSDIEVVPLKRSNTDLMLYFLEYGRLPWWSRMTDIRQLEARIMKDGPVPARFKTKFRGLIEEVPDTGKRLLLQFSDPFLLFILSACFPDTAFENAEDCIAWFRAFYGHEEEPDIKSGRAGRGSGKKNRTRDGRERKARVRGATDAELSEEELSSLRRAEAADDIEIDAGAGSSVGNPEITTKDSGTGMTDEGPIAGEKGVASPEGQTGSRSVGNKDKATMRDEEKGDDPLPGMSSSGQNDRSSQGRNPGKGNPGNNNRDKITDSNRNMLPDDLRMQKGALPEKRYSRSYRDDDEPVYTELAGLVILHPFLSEFFTALNLLEGKSFRDEAARHKGVHLLGYIATGEAEIQEHRLVFPKLLCGMELVAPVERAGVITQKEMEGAEELLRIVLSYWKALKSTSIDGLRDSFLQRAGKLSVKEEDWQLDVEKKTLDILLGKLPWGFSIIKFPWMRKMIFVNWG